MPVYAPNHLCTYAHQTGLSEFVLPNNCADRINMVVDYESIDFETEIIVLRRHDTQFDEITQNKGHYSLQGHSRSQILVPIESSFTTSY